MLNEQVRENCQLAKYAVLGVYALIGTGAILVIIGSIIKNNSYSNQPLSPHAKKSIIVVIGIIFAIIVGVIVYPFYCNLIFKRQILPLVQ
ncbi:hypothetical protein [Candidatus Nitrosotalea okcheonensis]|uniref:Uncharacterized protein n=1 Tax=Candidatus Nitrosotalea okcheonensis TaxID=1903276 RepID=A0A2H1FEX6_9ARCH|nr:hypothetical protein [Candidatus Nitrosotalea okcheonensis]SMH71332.1 protein of unknown function [Candidatus Nitrosotalea okcheonensis]